jgi:hypothetical protein
MTAIKMQPYPQFGAFRPDSPDVTQKKPPIFLDSRNDRGYCLSVTNPITEAARLLGSIKSLKKAKSSRENGKLGKPFGKLGGRPPKKGKKRA